MNIEQKKFRKVIKSRVRVLKNKRKHLQETLVATRRSAMIRKAVRANQKALKEERARVDSNQRESVLKRFFKK